MPRGEPGVLVHLRISPAAKALVDQVAAELGKTPSEVMRQFMSAGAKAYVNGKALG